MKDSMVERINAIKAGKFGVEVEMYNIRRAKAAEVIADYFGTRRTVRNEGGLYDKWTCEDSSGRKWTFMRDSSIHDNGRGGCEMVTPILGYGDIETLQEALRILRKNGAKSDPSHECGVHIHIDAVGHTSVTLRNLTTLMKNHDTLIMNAIGVTGERRRWCRPVDERFVKAINTEKPNTMDGVMRVWYESQGYRVSDRDEHYNSTRYSILNLHSLWQNKGIEFRCFQFDNPTDERNGGLHAGQMKAYIQLCLAICETAKVMKPRNVKASALQDRDPRKAMNNWMKRIGMAGNEFRTARTVFARRLETARRQTEVA